MVLLHGKAFRLKFVEPWCGSLSNSAKMKKIWIILLNKYVNIMNVSLSQSQNSINVKNPIGSRVTSRLERTEAILL